MRPPDSPSVSATDRAHGRLERLLASRGALLAIVAVGAVLRVVQYAANGSLWLDEASIARIVVGRPFAHLVPNGQLTPLGFLVIEKGIASLFGSGELVLRLFPLLCSLTALALFPRIAGRVLTGLGATLAVALFALGPGMVWYGPQVKQYALEILVSLTIWLLVVDAADRALTVGAAATLGAAGVVAVVFSQAVVFVLAGAGLALAVGAVRARGRDAVSALSVLAVFWGAAAAIAVRVGLASLTPDYRAYLQVYWAKAFMPLPPRNLWDLLWPFKRLAMLYGEMLLWYHYALAPILLGLAFIGAWALFRRRPAVALALFMPIAIVMAGAAARQYPFAGGRENAFLITAYVLAAAEGAEFLRTHAPTRLAGAAVMALVVALPLYALAKSPPPYTPEHVRPALERLRSRWRAGDVAYVYYGAEQAFRYYAPRLGFGSGDYVVSQCARDDPHRYLADLDRLRGRPRVWVVLTHDELFDERSLVFGYLDRIGRRVDAVQASGDVFVVLYDLSDPVRLAAADAGTYPVPLPSPDADTVACWNGIEATVP